MTLLDLQTLFWEAARGQVAPEVLDRHFVTRGPRTGADRLRIYNGAYFSRLEGALADTFPSTRALLGDSAFQHLARRHIVKRPSEHAALERIGAHFAERLHAELAERDKVIAEVAELEFARVCALLAPHDTAISGPLARTGTDLARVALHLARSLEVRRVSTRAFRLWQDPQGSRASTADGSERIGVAFWRRDSTVHHRTLDPTEAAVLEGSPRAVGLLDLCEQLASLEDAAVRSVAMIERWLSSGLVTRVDGLEATARRESRDGRS